MTLHSWKWTWRPVLLLMDTIKTQAYACHVMLCEAHNTRLNILDTPMDPRYMRPLKARHFYIMLGMQMMRYEGKSGYWFEPSETRDAARQEAAAKRGESVSPGAGFNPLCLLQTVRCCASVCELRVFVCA
jgi:hypothetical protein